MIYLSNYWQGNLIKLRSFEDKDLEKYINDRVNPDSKRQWCEDYIRFPFSPAEIKEQTEKYNSSLKDEDKRLFTIETLYGEYAGEISVWHTDRRNGTFKYGIFLDEKMRGKGYGKDALKIVLDFYFNELNYNKAQPDAYAFNNNSQKFHEKFGFVLEGVLRNQIYSRGEYHNLHCYGMLKNEFNKLHKHDFRKIVNS